MPSRTVWIIPPALKRWLYPTIIDVKTGHTETFHNRPYDGKPTRIDWKWWKRVSFGQGLICLHEANSHKGVTPGYYGWRLWWYTRAPTAGLIDFHIDRRPVELVSRDPNG